MDTLNDLMETMNERNIHNEMKELEIRAHLQTVDKKLEILSLKHKNMEVTLDSLVADMNECISQMHQKNPTTKKTSVS